MGNWWRIATLLGLVALAAAGLGRIRFDTDILSILPGEMPEVAGLKAFQEVFARDEELVVLIEGKEEHEGEMGFLAAELAGILDESGLSSSVRWQPRWQDDSDGLAELVGWLWANGDPAETEKLCESLTNEELEGTLGAALERVATSIDGGEMMLSAHDPFGFLGHSSMSALFESSGQGGEGFESADGRAHLLFVDAPESLPGYHAAYDWLESVQEVAEPWAAAHGLVLGWTGEPAFQAEIGTAMERDMRGTVGVTSVLIGMLFLIMQRRLALLAGLGLVLALIFLTAMGLAGWLYGDLSIMAAGFAAILIGLAVDYGVLICQEAKVAGHNGSAIYRSTSKSILWAAATTAAVFFALNFSGLPGIAQLGTIVGFGVIAGAVLMLGIYVPWVARTGAGRPGVGHKPTWVPERRWALLGGIVLLVSALLVLGTKGFPGVEFDRSLLRPRNSTSMGAFERIQEVFPEWDSPALRVVVEGETDEEVRERLREVRRRLVEIENEWPQKVRGFTLPTGWWPWPDHFEANRERLQDLFERQESLIAAADDIGFSEEGYGLGRAVMNALPEVLARDPSRLPDAPAAAEILRGYLAKDGAGGRVVGMLEVEGVTKLSKEDAERLRQLNGEGMMVAGWPLLKPVVLPLVRKDITNVFLPMAGLMVVMLSLVFRDVRDVLLALGAMAVSGAALLATMSVLGISWNFLNIAATPLLLGTGLDYTIHILLAMRRTRGDLKAVWNGTGKAVLFCGISTAIGFGSLCFASIDALRTLGQVAVLGILISMLVSVVLLPGVKGRR